MKTISEILLVFSSSLEAGKVLQNLYFQSESKYGVKSYLFNAVKVDVLIPGIGIPPTVYMLGKVLFNKRYDLVVNLGICGSFNKDIVVGTVVNVVEDEFADLGITCSDNSFKTLFDENFISENEHPYTGGKLISTFENAVSGLPKVKGITVNTTSGTKNQIRERCKKFTPDVESMEGAAVAYVCLSEKTEYLQIRAVSNLVEPRNRENWNIRLAVSNLSDATINLLKKFS